MHHQQQQTLMAVFALLVATSLPMLDAFAPLLSVTPSTPLLSNALRSSVPVHTTTKLWMAAEEGDDEEDKVDGEEAAAADGEGDGEEEKKEEEPKEDPEVAALKKEIAELETQLKSKRSTLQYTQDQAEEYTKAGYARKVAEMENMRRIRSSMNSSSRSMATANVVKEFLPVYDKMISLKEKYANDEFGAGYGGLSMTAAFSKMGIQEFTVNAGDPVDNYRMAVIESEYSTTQAKNTVIKPLAMGLELEGNVIRAAECVASLGSEEDAKKEKEEAEAKAKAAEEAKAAEGEGDSEEAP